MAGRQGPDAARLDMAGRGRANPDKQISLPVRQIALVVNGVHLLENMKLDELHRAGLRVRLHHAAAQDPGGSGSTVAPVAVR